jgi:hypothetical protein
MNIRPIDQALVSSVREASLAPPMSGRLAPPIQELLTTVLGESAKQPFKQLMLVGANAKVGTSLIARSLATQLSSIFGGVLLIEVRPDAVDDHMTISETKSQPVTRITMQPQTCIGLAARGQSSFPEHWLRDYDIVLWDVPPISVVPVALALAANVDGIVILAQPYRTRRQVALLAAQRLQEHGGRVIGVVLNRVKTYLPSWVTRES